MAGGWKSVPLAVRGVDIATNAAASQGIRLPANASTTYAKGAWTQLIASTAADSGWLLVCASSANSSGAAIAVDIGFGTSGNEIAIVTNLAFAAPQIGVAGYYMLPVTIPAGTRVAGRVASSVLSDSAPVQVLTFADGYSSAGFGVSVDTYGFQASTGYGLQIDPGGSANTKGAYVQLTASLSVEIGGFLLCFDSQGTTTGTTGAVDWLVDIAVGASGSEQVILPNLAVCGYSAGGDSFIFGSTVPYIPMPIPAGGRISVRAQCSTAATPDRLLGLTFYGIRQ